jgi:hypothetical protein
MSQSHPITEKQMKTVQRYLERAFPGQVRDTQWDGCAGMQVFEIVHENALHRVEMPAAFLKNCSDCAGVLQSSELADYMRESRDQARRFSVVWEDGSARVRSAPL